MKEVVTVPTVVETPEIDAPTIRIVPRPDPIKMRNADIVVVTEANLQEVIERIKNKRRKRNKSRKLTNEKSLDEKQIRVIQLIQ